MNKLIGLIKKDILELKFYTKNFILSLFIFIAIILINNNESQMLVVATSMVAFLFSSYVMATFNYDEKSKSENYILTFPVSRKKVVLAKYILLLLSLVTGVAIGAIIGLLLINFNIISAISISEYLLSILTVIFMLSLIHSIQIPSVYKYGAEKGRLQIYLVLMILFVLISVLYISFPNVNLNFLNKIENYIPYVILLLIIINYTVSYKISVKLYEKKDL